jgi:hypothetical protein
MAQTRGLRHGRVYHFSGGSVGVCFLSNPQVDNQPVRAELAVLPHGESERQVVVHAGERFTVGPETWVVERFDNAGTYDYVVWIAKVSG